MNIYQRMSAVTSELETVAKNLTVSTGKNSYKAVSERDIIDAVKPVEIKHGIYSYPYSRDICESEMLEKDGQYGKSTQFFTRLKTVYRFVNIDQPQEYIDITSYSTGLDSGDKGEGKAMTYGDKYALMKAYKISTGDDPDQNPSEPAAYTKASSGPRLASQNDKEKIIAVCNAMKLDFKKILTKTGWQDGEKLTQDQADKAMIILQEISDGREEVARSEAESIN